ncbi:prolyl-tRNA synthetase [Parvularcula bermudensis HTCC2503]|uniref:Proline--tRNA ligase n=1 Tax=Parvularcula bermudensis (strain ATCC BAA-594 / HTCC2503 / KCTC 12087) TaxID=314260 RepID=E0TBC4_PARBH|nr:proline--tRNA ligase [Parvularcula bermudensis]ADM08328.1 prolyl-tRNA synthetase [Parvularcula bermudensis HTCC2503]
MKLSRTYLPLLKETPAEAVIASHRLMLRSGMVRQQAAGIYAWLPLGLKVLKKVEAIVREEQERAGVAELLMPTIQPASLWHQSGRYDAYGPEMLRLKDRHGRDMLYGPTNEEMITELVRAGIKSYKELPKTLFHIQWKFRDEVRPRFGVMRGREFLMKDAYSFDLSPEAARRSYLRFFAAYLRTFARLGVKAIPVRADTGPIGGKLSHEFVVLAETGESEVFTAKGLVEKTPPPTSLDYDGDLEPLFAEWTGTYAATDEMHDEAAFLALPEDQRLQARGIEVGHIFYFGTKYSEPMQFAVEGPDGRAFVEMGSYGIGVSRLVGALIEAHHDDQGCRWPVPVAPYEVGLVNLKTGHDGTDGACHRLYDEAVAAGLDVLLDDSGDRAGEKFARMDLIGLPLIVTIGPRGVEAGQAEVKDRRTGAKQEVPLTGLVDYLRSAILPQRRLA